MVTWAWVAYTVDGHALGELTEARGRSLAFDLRGPATAKFTLDGRSDQGRRVAELTTDLYCWRDTDLLFRGRLGSTDDDLDADRHTTTWSAVDYRGVLAARFDGNGRIYDNWWQDDIAWNLIQVAYGTYDGITRGDQHAAGIQRTEVVDPDTTVVDVLDRFQDYDQGFEWWIDPHLRLQCATWRGADHTDFPLAWGVSVTSIRRSYDTGRYANWVRVRGGKPDDAESDAPNLFADRSVGARPLEGWVARTVNNSDLKTQEAVNAAADQLLADSLHPPAAYTCTILPGLWHGPASIWLGDRVPLILRSGRLDITATARVSQLDITLGDNGDETIQLTVGTD